MRRTLSERLALLFFLTLSIVATAWRLFKNAIREFILDLLDLIQAFNARRKKKRRTWRFRISKPVQEEDVRLTRAQMERLLKRAKDLKDIDDLAGFGIAFRMPEDDFIVTRDQAEETLRRILEANPPFLYLGRTAPADESASDQPRRIEKILKKERRRVQGSTILLVPEDRPIPRRAAFPPGEPSLRPARGFHELRRASIMDQVLPPLLQCERLSNGDMRVMDYVKMMPRVEFIPRERNVDYVEEREVEIEVELETPDPDEKTQLIYFLMDTSASMKGISATLAAAVFCAIHRANMGAPAHYYMRSFDDTVRPAWDQDPWVAETVQEREALYEAMFSLNFKGSSTHTGWALEAACRDIDAARSRNESLGKASIILITDGRSDIQPETIAIVRKTGAPVHTIMVAMERNADLERLSESFTTLSGLPDAQRNESPAFETTAPLTVKYAR